MNLSRYGISTLDHMTHSHNLETIFSHDLLSHNNQFKRIDISNREVNSRRDKRENIYGKKIHEYVPFYFNPRNAMMYRNKEEDIVVLGFDSDILDVEGTLFTDKNAATHGVNFYNTARDLEKIDWATLYSQSWYNKGTEVKQTMMAEVLIPKRVGIENLRVVYVKNYNKKRELLSMYNLGGIEVIVEPQMFFKY